MNLCYLELLVLDELLIQTSSIQFMHSQINTQKWFTNQAIKIKDIMIKTSSFKVDMQEALEQGLIFHKGERITEKYNKN
jgi:hypothetical protein